MIMNKKDLFKINELYAGFRKISDSMSEIYQNCKKCEHHFTCDECELYSISDECKEKCLKRDHCSTCNVWKQIEELSIDLDHTAGKINKIYKDNKNNIQ